MFNPVTRAESEIVVSQSVDVFDCNYAQQVCTFMTWHTMFKSAIVALEYCSFLSWTRKGNCLCALFLIHNNGCHC